MRSILTSLSPFVPPLPERVWPGQTLTLLFSQVPLLWAHLIETGIGAERVLFLL